MKIRKTINEELYKTEIKGSEKVFKSVISEKNELEPFFEPVLLLIPLLGIFGVISNEVTIPKFLIYIVVVASTFILASVLIRIIIYSKKARRLPISLRSAILTINDWDSDTATVINVNGTSYLADITIEEGKLAVCTSVNTDQIQNFDPSAPYLDISLAKSNDGKFYVEYKCSSEGICDSKNQLV